MGNRVTVKLGPELVSVRPDRKNARGHHMGTVMLKNVTMGRDTLTGDLLDEFSEIRELSSDVLDKLTELVFESGQGFGTITVHETDEDDEIVMFHSVTGNQYRAAYVCGSNVYVG